MKSSPYTRQRKALKSDMNVVPYIDVMLVLLVIFMVTAPMLTTGVEVDLPKHKASTMSSNARLPVIVTLTKKDELYLDYEGNEKKVQLQEAELIATLAGLQKEQKSKTGNDLQVMLNADKGNQYGKIVALMAQLQQAGVVKVGLLTDSPAKKK